MDFLCNCYRCTGTSRHIYAWSCMSDVRKPLNSNSKVYFKVIRAKRLRYAKQNQEVKMIAPAVSVSSVWRIKASGGGVAVGTDDVRGDLDQKGQIIDFQRVEGRAGSGAARHDGARFRAQQAAHLQELRRVEFRHCDRTCASEHGSVDYDDHAVDVEERQDPDESVFRCELKVYRRDLGEVGHQVLVR